MIYKTFKEWEEGNYLEDLEPRKEAYTQQELDLIEMGWNYGVDAEREACAKVCEVGTGEPIQMKALEMLRQERERIAKAIRARGQ
jgi:hypothetical protein